MAAAEMQGRLAAGMMGLRRGLSAARSLHSSLRSEATALESFIPVIVEGARSGMQQALQNQVLSNSKFLPPNAVKACIPHPAGGSVFAT